MTTSSPILPPLSLYIHVPWCVRKCPYCDFNSHQQQGALPETDYVDALIRDLQQDSDYIQGRDLHSIFIGGGTPSLFSAASYAKLLAAIQTLVAFADDIEVTLEANPGTFEQEKFSAYRAAGINRLSIGVQSFNDSHLNQLGRIHGADEARRAADIAHNAGFNNFNLDLMFGLPGQTTAQARADLETGIACASTHLSWYQLTIEPNTEYFSRPPLLPQDDAIAEMQEEGIALLEAHGFARYEISAYSKTAWQARHNVNYWNFGDYIGIGAGAHGKITLADTGVIVRTRKTRMPGHYLDKDRSFAAETKPVAVEDLPLEFMLNALRLTGGVPMQYFAERTRLPGSTLQASVLKLQRRGLLCNSPLRLQPTALGLLHLNELLLEFM